MATPTINGVSRHRTGARIAAALAALVLAAAPAAAGEDDPTWQPRISERLVKLPAKHLVKSLDNDFTRSALGRALRDIDADIGLKAQTLADLKSAVAVAEGEVRTELRYRFLAEKRAYLELMSRKHALRRRQAETKARLLEEVLDRLGRDKAGATPARLELIRQQEAVRRRFRAAASTVDLRLFASSAMPESRYAGEYARNLSAIEALSRAIEAHPMNAAPAIDGRAMTKQDYIRQNLANAQADLALIDQQERILGYMAKLVALDAMALSEQVADTEAADGEAAPSPDITGAVDLFVAK